jgi:hypothetical protein
MPSLLMPSVSARHRRARARAVAGLPALLCAVLLGGCGGGNNANPADNPPDIANPTVLSTTKRLSFAYFQRCVQPILEAELPSTVNGVPTMGSCAASGCHDRRSATGGALRLVAGAQFQSFEPNPSNTTQLRQSEMYRNFISAQAAVVPGQPADSLLLNKPLGNGVLHAGGVAFTSANDLNARVMAYWIARPLPEGQDEFSAAGNLLFPIDVTSGVCNVP